MNIIFLDVDGVLNNSSLLCEHGINAIGEDQLNFLKRIVENTNSKIVLSSTWRLFKENLQILKDKLLDKGMSILDSTPVSFNQPRSVEIKQWLSKNHIQKFAIIDDDDDAAIGDNFFKCDFEIGLTNDIANKVISHFSNELIVP